MKKRCYICNGKVRQGDFITLSDHIIDSSDFPLCIKHMAEVSRWLAKMQKKLILKEAEVSRP